MERVTINQELCLFCGHCGQVCPHRLLHVGHDRVTVETEGCMGCGHCRAVCPVGAVDIAGLDEQLGLATLPEYTSAIPAGDYDAGRLVQLLRSRRSCRNYRSRAVEVDVLEDLVKIGTTAPSGTNSQGWNFIILPTRGDVEYLGDLTADYYRDLNHKAEKFHYRLLARLFAGDALARYYRTYYDSVAKALVDWDEHRKDRLFHGAVAAILVTGKKGTSCPAEDALLATQNMILAAHAMGLGTCLIGFVVEAMRRRPSMVAKMKVADDETVYSVIGVGYPALEYTRVAARREVRPRYVSYKEMSG